MGVGGCVRGWVGIGGGRWGWIDRPAMAAAPEDDGDREGWVGVVDPPPPSLRP